MEEKDTTTSKEHAERYAAALHAMQSGVAMWMTLDGKESSPKHLRTGVNSAMSDHGALVKLLFSKGVITEEEYYKALADQMEAEARSYEAMLSTRMGRKVTLL